MDSAPYQFGKLLAGGMIILASIGGCATVSPTPIAVEKAEWTSPIGITGTQLLTEHYDLRLTVTDSVLVEYLAPFMESAFTQYHKLMPPALESSDRLVIYLFDTRAQWAEFTRIFVPGQAHTYLHIQSGGYMDHKTATAVAHDIRRDRTLSLLAHEGWHQYLARFFPERVPAWLNEGLACQWEAFDPPFDRPVFTPHRNLLRKNSLREALATEDGLIDLLELLRMHAGHAVVETGQHVRSYYAQVWSMVLYLREGPDGKYTDRFAKLLEDAGTDRFKMAINAYRAATPSAGIASDGEIAFRQYITEDFDGFRADYRTFARYLVN